METQSPVGAPVSPGEDDAILIARTLAGDSTAFDDLVRRYHRQAVAVAYRRLGSLQDASDVAQDAFLRAYRSLGSLKDRGRFGPWLMRIVGNLALNALRSRRSGGVGSALSLDDVGDKVGELRSADGAAVLQRLAPHDTSGSEETQEAVRRALEALPDKQRLALVLFSIEGLPQKEVADLLDCSVELVKWNVFQARKKLREMLADYL